MILTCDDVRDLAAGFVLGALAREEDAAVREHLATCPEPHPELAELGGVVSYLAESLDPVEPPVSLRARLMATAAAERPAEGAGQVEPTAPPTRVSAPAPMPFPTTDERAARAAIRARGWSAWALRIAAGLAIAALGAWNLQLQVRLSGVERDLVAAQAFQEGVATVLAVATQPGARTAFMAATEPGTSASGVAAAASDGTVVVAMHGLVPTEGSQVYEAWVIVGDAAPVPLGGFTVGDDGTGLLRAASGLAGPGAVLALTLEPGPGADAPTLPVLNLGSLRGGT
ncbi:MAG TPA: anti-sigma factor [Candidatus Sulfomarinibacteraceae bacterium]|nr:anti-sigma factor [Candidatus Sulfomarinibacteraceae bacterium]